jgi:hypothetical protein
VILALAASLAIVVQDRAALRAAPRAAATELTTLGPGDVVEIRGEREGYLKVYNYRRERGGYLPAAAVRPIGVQEADAPELLAVMRFLRDTPGAEALGISYGAAYLRAVPSRALSAEPFVAIGTMAERLAQRASGNNRGGATATQLDVVEQFGVHMRSFERDGHMQVCYDGELFRRALALPNASAEARAQAALALTQAQCIDPAPGPAARAQLDEGRLALLAQADERSLSPLLRSRLHARRASVWAAVSYARARHGLDAGPAAQRALDELLAVHADELGESYRSEFLDAQLRVGAVRWAALLPAVAPGALRLSAAPGAAGQTCLALEDTRQQPVRVLTRRCTYGIAWLASSEALPQDRGMVIAVQPLESWRELWVFHDTGDGWAIDVVSPGVDAPEQGYVDYAGFAPVSGRLLLAREVREHGRFRRRFEEYRLSDLALVKDASAPELLADFGRWQDVRWRRDSLALR